MPLRDTILSEGYVPLSTTEAYEVPLANKTKITKVQAYNSDTVSRELTVYIVPLGDTAGPENKIVAISLETGESKIVGELMLEVMDVGYTIQHSCDLADKVTVRYNGRQQTIN